MIIFHESRNIQLMHIHICFLQEKFWNKRGLEYAKGGLESLYAVSITDLLHQNFEGDHEYSEISGSKPALNR